MSSKNAESPKPPPVWSLATRLTRYYVIAAAVILSAAVFFLHWMLERGLNARDRAQVVSKAQVLQSLLREHHDKPEVIISEVEHEAAENQALRYYLRILDGQGRTLMETTGMKDILPPAIFPPPAPEAATRYAGGRTMLSQHQRYLLAAVEAETGLAGEEKRSLQVALDLSATLELVESYHLVLLSALLGSVALMSLAGWSIARQGIRPLVQLAEASQRITASRLQERVSSQGWPVELSALARAFDDMLDRLGDSFQRLSAFSADIAHALRNPINNLRGEAEVTLSHPRSPEEYQQMMGSSLEELERLSRMIDNLLFIARADDASMALKRTPFAVRQELEAVKEFYEAVADEARLTVECEGNALVNADPLLVRRAISNLLGNALKHTPAGGRVTLIARAAVDGGAEIAVQDTGMGIPEAMLPRVFDRFFQVDKSRDLTAKGAGLGLAIVKSIMQLHGGEATAQSVLGRGTTMTLRFPPAPSGSREM